MDHSLFMHEINNSLNSIYGICQLINESNNVKEIKEYSALIKDSVEVMKNIESDFNEYRKTGREKINYSVIDVSNLVKEIIKSNKNIINQYKIQVKATYRRARAYTDINKLKQVINNLFNNACKYSNPNGIVEVICYTSNSSAKVVIRDHGIGLTEEELKHVGTAFYRTKRLDRPGTGLGLGIVKKISKLLNWDFNISSTLGEGTKVELVLHHIIG